MTKRGVMMMIGLGYWEPPSGEEGGRVLCWNSLMQILEAHTLVTLGGGYNTPLDESEDKGLRRLNIFPNSSSKLVQSQGLNPGLSLLYELTHNTTCTGPLALGLGCNEVPRGPAPMRLRTASVCRSQNTTRALWKYNKPNQAPLPQRWLHSSLWIL